MDPLPLVNFALLQNGLSFSRNFGGKESPDSIEQPTGEQPGCYCWSNTSNGIQIVPQKITAIVGQATHNGEGENVR